MQKNSILLVLLFFISYMTQAQENNEVFSKAVNYCNCKFAYTYCQSNPSNRKGLKADKSFNLIQNALNCNIENPLSYDSLGEILKRNNFSLYIKDVGSEVDKLNNEYHVGSTTEQQVSQIITKIFDNPKLAKIVVSTGFSSQKKILETELLAYFNKHVETTFAKTTISIPLQPDVDTLKDKLDRIQQQVNVLAESKPGFFSPNWISIILIFIVFGFLLYIIFDRYLILEDKLKQFREESKLAQANWNQRQSPNINAKELTEFKRTIERSLGDLNDAIGRMQNSISILESKNSAKQDILLNQQSNNEKQRREEIFYASIPNKDGSFNESSININMNSTESFFKFTKMDSHKASFEFLNDERAAKNASNSPELILYPICKIKNSPRQDVKRIRTITPGIMVKRNDKWELDTSAVIEYE